MEQNREEVTQHLEQVRIRVKSSPTTSSESDKGADSTEHAQGSRKRHRRGRHRRKWKPYSSMTWDEKRVVEAKEAARAARREADLAGKPSAPWNTTQFIMEDRGCNDVWIPTPRASRTLSLEDSLSEEDLYESPEDELFEQSSLLEQDFESTYQEVAAERLQGLSKAELVEECLVLERELHSAQDQGREELSKMEAELKKMKAQLLALEEKNKVLQAQQKSDPV
jgi:protein HEXIM1/2